MTLVGADGSREPDLTSLCLLENTCVPTGCMENCDYFALQTHYFAMVLQTSPDCGANPSHPWVTD